MNRLTKNTPTEESINGYTDDVIAALRKLKKYEDLEEQGKLVEIKCHCKDCKESTRKGCSGTTVYCYEHECYMHEDDFCSDAYPFK